MKMEINSYNLPAYPLARDVIASLFCEEDLCYREEILKMIALGMAAEYDLLKKALDQAKEEGYCFELDI